MELENITFIQYLNLKDKSIYDYVSNYSRVLNKPEDIFKIGDFTKLTFGQVKDAQFTFKNGVYWHDLINFVSYIKNISHQKISNNKFFTLCKVRRFIEEQLNEIYKLELNIYHDVSNLDESAGIDSLNKYGVLIQIDKLAGGDILKYDAIKNLPYNLCFTKLMMDKDIELYNIQKNKLSLSNNSRNS